MFGIDGRFRAATTATQVPQEVGGDVLGGDADSVGVQRLDLVGRYEAGGQAELISRVTQPFVAPRDVFGGEAFAVVPMDALADVEDVGLLVWHIPGLGQPWDDL